jgi:hypothetical protein
LNSGIAFAYVALVRRGARPQKNKADGSEATDHSLGREQAATTLELFSRVELTPPLQPPTMERWPKELRQRMRVVLHTLPLTDLHRNQGMAQPELRHYDALALAMKVLDLIVESMGMEQEVDRRAVVRALGPLLSAMDMAHGLIPEEGRHLAMAERLLDNLRNDGNHRHPFQIEYTDFDEAGVAVQRLVEFRLIEDRHHPIEGIVLRLSNEAINLFLGAFELDIEDAQAAAEAVVRSQLDRGKFHEAVQSARGALLQTLRMQEKIDGILKQTRRDVTRVDWREATPRLLDEAVEHVLRRVGVEQGILETAQERLKVLPTDHDQATPLRHIIEIIQRCRLRHMELQDQLMRARCVFLDEQERQAFSVLSARALPELGREVLEPLLAMPARTAEQIVIDVSPAFSGPGAPALLSLRGLIGWQLQPRREIVRGEILTDAPDLVTYGEDEARFSKEEHAEVDAMLDGLSEPVLLSELLAQAASRSGTSALPALVALRVLQDFAPDEELSTPGKALRIDPIGAWFDVAGFCGDELSLCPPASPSTPTEGSRP